MTEVEQLLRRQARWQESRRSLSWPKKIKMSERMRPSVEVFCSIRDPGPWIPVLDPLSTSNDRMVHCSSAWNAE
jgi:hypothetical protein